MSRRGVRKIDQVQDPLTGRTVEIRLHMEDSTFEADVAGEAWSDKDLGALKARVLKHLREQASLVWMDVIEVEMGSSFYQREGLRVTFQRYWVANREGGKRPLVAHRLVDGLITQSEPDSDERRATRGSVMHKWGSKGDLIPPCNDKDATYWLLYTAETWAALEYIQAQIENARKSLKTILSSAEGTQRLEDVGRAILRMLPAPKGDET